MFQEAFPIPTVADIEAVLVFYRDQLELAETYRFPEEGDPVYVGLELGPLSAPKPPRSKGSQP